METKKEYDGIALEFSIKIKMRMNPLSIVEPTGVLALTTKELEWTLIEKFINFIELDMEKIRLYYAIDNLGNFNRLDIINQFDAN